LANKDLDLPTQQELLAQFRCDEIAKAALDEFDEAIKPLRRPVETGGVLASLGDSMRKAREETLCSSSASSLIAGWVLTSCGLARFDKEASRYHAGVYQRKRSELTSMMHASLSPLFVGQLKNLHKVIVRDFRTTVLERLKGDDYNFAELVNGAKAKAEGDFKTEAEGMTDGMGKRKRLGLIICSNCQLYDSMIPTGHMKTHSNNSRRIL
jgi:hypothetical protein